MKKLLTALLLASLLCGCSHLPKPRPWTKDEKVMLTLSIGAVVADYYTTERMLDRGYKEMNPLMGKYPTDTELTIKTGALYGAFLLIAHYWPQMRRFFLFSQTTAQTGFALQNSRLK